MNAAGRAMINTTLREVSGHCMGKPTGRILLLELLTAIINEKREPSTGAESVTDRALDRLKFFLENDGEL